MPTLRKQEEFLSVDLHRDECIVVSHKITPKAERKKAFLKLASIVSKMPRGQVDTVAEVREIRSSGASA